MAMGSARLQESSISSEAYQSLISKPIIKSVDMSQEMQQEIIDIMMTAMDKFASTKNNEAAAQLIKNSLDKKYGMQWHCVIGEGFSFEIVHLELNMICVYYGNTGCLAFKC